MICMSIDLGWTTGVAIGEVATGIVPWIYEIVQIQSQDYRELIADLHHLYHSRAVQMVIVEYPVVSLISNVGGVNLGLQDAVHSWLHPIDRPALTHREVRPSEWKTTPAALLSIQVREGHRKMSQHERDAIHILYWYALFGMD